MKVAFTGATGFIGSHVLTDLQKHGHEVTALVRDDTHADTVAARDAKAAVLDLYDRPAVASLLSKVHAGDLLRGVGPDPPPVRRLRVRPAAALEARALLVQHPRGPVRHLLRARPHRPRHDGHADAIDRICAWLDAWRQDCDNGPWWPQWITRDELRTRRPTQPGPLRPSWCYGTPGLARAQQLAGVATGDTARQDMAEQALTACLSDPAQLSQITDSSMCHGWAGLFHTTWRAARDARTPVIAACPPHVTELFTQHGHPGVGEGTGLLEGNAGLALALHTAARTRPPVSGWDACLLIG